MGCSAEREPGQRQRYRGGGKGCGLRLDADVASDDCWRGQLLFSDGENKINVSGKGSKEEWIIKGDIPHSPKYCTGHSKSQHARFILVSPVTIH